MEIKLKLIDSNNTYSPGYGAGEGSLLREEYECPCGEGKVVYTKDDIPGFKDRYQYIECQSCRALYETVSRGILKRK